MKNCDTCKNSGTVPAPNGFEPCPDCDPRYFTDLMGERIKFRYPKVTRTVKGVESFRDVLLEQSPNSAVLLDQPLPEGFEPVVALAKK